MSSSAIFFLSLRSQKLPNVKTTKSPSTNVPKMRHLLHSVRAVLYSSLLIDKLHQSCQTLSDYCATCSKKAVDKTHFGVTTLRRLSVAAYFKIGWLLWWLLLYIVSIAAVCIAWCRWVVQAVRAGPGTVWCPARASRIRDSLYDFGGRLSMFDRRVESCFSEAVACVRQTLAYAMTKFMALVWLLTMYPVVLIAKVGRLRCFAHPACFLPGMRTSMCNCSSQHLTGKLCLQSMAFVVEKWIEWFVPRCFIKAMVSGAHILYLLSTDCLCAAFWTALRFEAHRVDHAQLEVLHI